MTENPVLRLEGFCAGYGGGQVVSDASFTLERGQAAALLGLNGCGKTTLIKGVCGLIPSQGDCLVQGLDPRKMNDRSRARHISYISQALSIPFSASLLDIVLMGFNPVLGLLEQPGKLHTDKALEALDEVGLKNRAHEDITTLSQGQRQLVILARALIQDTPLLLFDEPDSALDFTNRHMVFGTLERLLLSRSKAAVLSMHDANFALQYCPRLLLMKQGRIIADICPALCSMKDLEEALSGIYGSVKLLMHDDHYVMVRSN